jgi:transglutaminase/protease-like cytokinesis protein 3
LEAYLQKQLERAKRITTELAQAKKDVDDADVQSKLRNKEHIAAATKAAEVQDKVNRAIAAEQRATSEWEKLNRATSAGTKDPKLDAAKKLMDQCTQELTTLDKELLSAKDAITPLQLTESESITALSRAQERLKKRQAEAQQSYGAADAAVCTVARRLLQEGGLSDLDAVSRARFFFTWIASRIRYRKSALDLNYRGPSVTLFNGYEVCEGYAKLFQLMFNADPRKEGLIPESERCQLIRGWGKQGPDDNVPKEGREKRLHAWNKFPIPRSGTTPVWKVCIDRTVSPESY